MKHLFISLSLIALTSFSAQARGHSGGSVEVHGYTRKNGTYVGPYTRNSPHSIDAGISSGAEPDQTKSNLLQEGVIDQAKANQAAIDKIKAEDLQVKQIMALFDQPGQWRAFLNSEPKVAAALVLLEKQDAIEHARNVKAARAFFKNYDE